MPRLFVAAQLPSSSIAELVRIQPPAAQGVRLTPQDQMHLTLHFLGEADVGRTRAALQSVQVPAFSITFEGVGHFPSFGGGMIAWAGVRYCAELMQLHAAMGDALSVVGFQPEMRPYTPHITLARCKTAQASAAIKPFLARQKGFQLSDQPVTAFGLYSSTVVDETRIYVCEQLFPLD